MPRTEWANLADQPESAGIKAELARWLPDKNAEPRKKK